jgi:hypothetical protein
VNEQNSIRNWDDGDEQIFLRHNPFEAGSHTLTLLCGRRLIEYISLEEDVIDDNEATARQTS